jgi:hypothetical protein
MGRQGRWASRPRPLAESRPNIVPNVSIFFFDLNNSINSFKVQKFLANKIKFRKNIK